MPISRKEFEAGDIGLESQIMVILRAYNPEVLNLAELKGILVNRLRLEVGDQELLTVLLTLEGSSKNEIKGIRGADFYALMGR